MATTEEMAAKRLKMSVDDDPVLMDEDDPVLMDDDDPLIYIAVRRDCAHDWYVLAKQNIVEIKHMSSYDDGINKLRFSFACTLMKAKLYMIGGQERLKNRIPPYTPPLDHVLVFDLTQHHPRKWRYGPKMQTPRTSPTVVRHNKGIYVFGGGTQVLKEYWAEYLSEKPGSSWVKLKQPPREITDSSYPFYKASVVAGSNIILWNIYRFILFDTVNESWQILQVSSIPVSFPAELYLQSCQMVCVNDSLVWCCVDMVSFDFVTRKTTCIYDFDRNLDTPWPSFQSCQGFFSLPHLFATKTNALSLIWSEPADEQGYLRIMYNNIDISTSQSNTHISLTKELKVPGDRIYCSGGRKSLNASADLSISDPLDFLATLHRKIIAINFNMWASETREPLQLVESDELILVPREVYPDMDTFMKDLDLEGYLEFFKREEIDLSTLKSLTNEHFENLNIPLAHRQKLRQGLANL
ncbi:hypothetical protein ACHQM5_018158 [Ranunculus cassubicifolius]